MSAWPRSGVKPDMTEDKRFAKAKGMETGMDRRSFLGALAGCGAAGLGGMNAQCSPGNKEKAYPAPDIPDDTAMRNNPLVVLLKRPEAMDDKGNLSSDKASTLMNDLVSALGEGNDPAAVLGRIFPEGSRVGIKLNCLSGRGLSPRPELVHAFIDILIRSGIRPEDITVFERTERELEKAGFHINMSPGKVRFMGNDSLGAGYDREPVCSGSIGSCFSTILTRRIDGLVSFGVLKDHDLAGVSVGLKNLFGLIHNPNKYHDNNCSPYVADVAASPPVRSKLKLTLCDGMTAQHHGGPALRKECTWNAGILLASQDPVAADSVGAAIIEEKRSSAGMKSLDECGRPPAYLAEARKKGLGENRMDKITCKRI